MVLDYVDPNASCMGFAGKIYNEYKRYYLLDVPADIDSTVV